MALKDGDYVITATAVDQFGHTTTTAPVVITSNLLIDTTGPVIAGAFFNRLNGQVDYIIKDPVPANGGTPSRGLGQHPARLVQLPLDQGPRQ